MLEIGRNKSFGGISADVSVWNASQDNFVLEYYITR